jgi:lactate permease
MLIDWLLALLPILVIIGLMVGFRWGAAKAGPAGWFVALLVALLRFGAGIDLIALAHVKALLLTSDVLLITWSAFLLYRVADEAGAIQILSHAIPGLTKDRGLQALLIGWAFASFLQGVGGFGVPTAVTAPLLVGLGFSPVAAVLIPSIGHSWSVTFGSLATSFQALIASTGYAGEILAPPAAAFLAIAGLVCGYQIAHISGGWGAIRRLLWPILILGIAMGGTQFWLSTHGLWNIAALGGGSAGLIVGFIIARFRGRETSEQNPAGTKARLLMLALSGYIALVVITLAIQFITPLRSALNSIVIRVHFPAVPGAGLRILKTTVQRMLPSSLGITAMVSMAVIMSHAGMTETLARGLSEGMGYLFPVISPWIGGLGAFMTGSNTNSNVVFANIQLRTAELLGLSVPIILAAQTAGGALGSVIAPTKIIVGASTTDAAGKEGSILRSLLVYVFPLIGLISLLTLLALWVTSL